MSIVSISYNQEEYIREALDGFAAQRTEFPVEVIIADDASTDATPRIIGEYAARYPQLFRPILRQTNIGVHANFKMCCPPLVASTSHCAKATITGPIR